MPKDVRESCATLITYAPEATKLNEVLKLTSNSLKDGKEMTLDSLYTLVYLLLGTEVALIPTMKRTYT